MNPEKFLNKETIETDMEQTLSQIEEIKGVLPENESELNVSKLSDKTRRLIMVTALVLSTTFAALIPKESGAQNNPYSNVYGSTPGMSVYGGTGGGHSGPTYEEQKGHKKVEIAAGIFYEIFKFIGHNKVHKKHHPKQKPPAQPNNTYNGPR